MDSLARQIIQVQTEKARSERESSQASGAVQKIKKIWRKYILKENSIYYHILSTKLGQLRKLVVNYCMWNLFGLGRWSVSRDLNLPRTLWSFLTFSKLSLQDKYQNKWESDLTDIVKNSPVTPERFLIECLWGNRGNFRFQPKICSCKNAGFH